MIHDVPPEPPPVGQVRVNPDGDIVAVRFDEDDAPWICSDGLECWDDEVRDWHVMIREDDPRVVPQGHVSIDATDLDGLDSDLLRRLVAKATWAGCGLTALIVGRVAEALLARRGESA